MKKLSILFIFITSIFFANAQSVVIPSVGISPTSLQTLENKGSGVAEFYFGECSGQAIQATYQGEPNITISLNLLYIGLMASDLNQISGNMLDYFTVSYDETTKVLLFEQNDVIPGYFYGSIEFPVEVTQNSTRTESFNGFYAVLKSDNPEIDARGNASIFTFTDTNSQAGPTYDEANEENVLFTGLTVFPNPAKDVVNVTLSDDEILKIELFDLLGKRILSKTYNPINKVELNISNFATNVYVLKVYTKEHTRSLKLFKE